MLPWCSGSGRRIEVRTVGVCGPGQRVVARRVVEADMRGLVTAGPCVRLERVRWSKDERDLGFPDGVRLLIARGRVNSSRCEPGC